MNLTEEATQPKFVQKWSAKVEYLHYDLGSVTFSNGALRTSGQP